MRFKPYLLLLIGYCLLFGSSQNLFADEYQLDTHFCYGNPNQVIIEGRIIEKRFESQPATASDNMFTNIWHKFSQFFNEEEEASAVYVKIMQALFKTKTDEEGYFRFDLKLKKPIKSGYQSVELWARAEGVESRTECQLYVVPNTISFGIISDFDDTVIISEVTNKMKLLANTFTKNYIQRDAVEDMAKFYFKMLQQNSNPDLAPLFFITGSPRQIQKDILDFLDLHRFPPRIVITKKLNGGNSDPLFDQFTYKTGKIEELFKLLPNVKFLLVGDDGEKDPEVYYDLQSNYPDHVSGIWIRQVSADAKREKFPGQKYFNSEMFNQ